MTHDRHDPDLLDPDSPAAIALHDVLAPTSAHVADVTGRPLLDCIVAAAFAAGIEVPRARIDQARRGDDGDVRAVAQTLRVAVRPVRLAGRWWRGGTDPYVVTLTDGTPAALLPSRTGYRIWTARGAHRCTAATAALVRPDAVAVPAALPAEAATPRDLASVAVTPGTGRDVMVVLGLSVAAAALGVVAPIVAGVVLGQLVPMAEDQGIVVAGLVVALAALTGVALGVFTTLVLTRAATSVNARALAAVLGRTVGLPLSFHRDHPAGEVVQRVLGVQPLASSLSSALVATLTATMLALSGTVVMLVVQPRLAVAVLVVLAVAGLVSLWWLRALTRARSRYVAAEVALSARTLSLLSGTGKIRVAGAESRVENVWALEYARQQRAARDASDASRRLALVAGVAPTLVTIVVVVGSVTSVTDRLGAFTTFVTAAGQVAGACAALMTPLALLLGAVPLIRALRPLLEAVPDVGADTVDPGPLQGAIRLTTVSFSYDPAGPEVLDDITLEIPAGEFVAVVGVSGSGKSTLLRLMLGLETPNAGQILYDGRPLDRMDADAVRRQIGVVVQDAQLTAGTLLDNIIGTGTLTEEDAWEAAERAGIAADIAEMPMGMRTWVSDGAATFSGGQKQRILLARALARRPRIVVLDEATSALDNRTQAMVARSLASLGATRIVVAHRLSTVREADRIVVLDSGRIAEQGSYEDLVAAGGLFATMAARQTAD